MVELIKCDTCNTQAEEHQMTQVEGFSGRYVCEWCWQNN
jgi:formylmethanofuran dehydrogenase subunit E